MTYPTIKILPGEDRRLRNGSPWLFSNELRMDADAKALPPGGLVRLMAPSGKMLGVAQFNPHSLIAARMLTRNKDAQIDRAFLTRRIARALQLRERLFDTPHYRLIHAEADGLPGLVVDRFGDTLVVQLNTAGMEALREPMIEALDEVVRPRTIIARNNSPSRQHEGLASEVTVLKGEPGPRLELIENGLDLPGRPCRRAEDRLVLRPARQSPLRGRALQGRGGARPLQLLRRLRADRGGRGCAKR